MAQAVLTIPPSRRSPFWHLLLIWLLAPALALSLTLARFETRHTDRIYPGVQALGVDLSGMTRAEAEAALTAAAASYNPPPLAIRHGDQLWPLPAQELGLQVDVNGVVYQAFALGRSGAAADNLRAQWRIFWRGERLAPHLTVHPGAVATAIASRTAHLNRAVTEPKITLSDLQVVVSAPRPGQMVDVEATRAQVLAQIASGRGGVVDVALRELPVVASDVSAEREAIQQLLERPIVLADGRGEFQFALDPAALSGLLSWAPDATASGRLRAEMDEGRLRGLVESWVAQIARPPLNARFDFNTRTNTLVELAPSADGYALDVDATVAAILEAIRSGETNLTLPVQVIRPLVASEDAAHFGIKELVAEGASRFAGSSADRVKNIELSASRFVGVVIPPDGVFSFNEHVGDVTAANGFEDALVIAGDRTAVGVGGGVCQVSTTVFRAAWFGGFPIVERWNHGYVVSWYGTPGLDATIYTPTVDFRFRNTTGHYLLIKPIVDSDRGVLTFQFYGTKPGWTVETTAPQHSNRVAPPPPLYIEDTTLPAGRVVQFDWAVEGLEAEARRRVVAADGTVLSNDVLRSKYQPWQAKFYFGSGYQPPANAEVRRAP